MDSAVTQQQQQQQQTQPTTPPAQTTGSSTPRIYGNESLSNRISQFQTATEKNIYKQKQNPFSGSFEVKSLRGKYNPNDSSYGRPKPGSKTEARGIKAHESVEDEIRVLCQVIDEHGTPISDGLAEIKFGELFRLYSVISNKVVGILIRARKHGWVEFEGEMLYQGRDDAKIIKLLKSPPRGIQITKNTVFKSGQSVDLKSDD